MNPRDADHRDPKLAPDGSRMTIVSGLRLYSGLRENHYNARFIDTVLIIHIYFAPQSVDSVKTVFQVTAVYMLLATHIGPINDIKGPAGGLICYVSIASDTQWFHLTHLGNVWVNPFYNGVLYSLRKAGLRLFRLAKDHKLRLT